MKEIGIYRVSGLSSDVHKLKKAFEMNPYEGYDYRLFFLRIIILI